MTVQLPTEWTTSCVCTIKIQDHPYDFQLRLSVFGEVLEAENYFLQLPLEARKMLMGGKEAALYRKLEACSALLRYYLPLVAMGYLRTREWESAAYALDKLKRKLAISDLCRYKGRIRDPWVAEAFHRSCTYRKVVFRLLAALLQRSGQDRIKLLYELNECHEPLVAPVLRLLLRLHEEDVSFAEHLLVSIGATRTEASRELLLQFLNDADKVAFYGAALRGLANFRDESLRDRLKEVYYRKRHLLMDKDFNHLIEAFRHYPGPETETILREVMTGTKILAARIAFGILKGFGVPSHFLVRYLRVALYKQRSVKEVTAALAVLNELRPEDHPLLPDSNELTGLFAWLVQLLTGRKVASLIAVEQLNNALAAVLEKRVDESTFRQLGYFLRDEDTRVVRYALKHFAYAGASEIPIIAPLLQHQEQRIRDLAADVMLELQKKA